MLAALMRFVLPEHTLPYPALSCSGRRKGECSNPCRWDGRCKHPRPDRIFRASSLTEDQRRWCRCTVSVRGAANPYAICAEGVATTTGGRSCNFALHRMPVDRLANYARLRQKKDRALAAEVAAAERTLTRATRAVDLHQALRQATPAQLLRFRADVLRALRKHEAKHEARHGAKRD